MKKKDRQEALRILGLVLADVENDMKSFDGLPFTGLTVGRQFGYQAAAIVAVATILKALVEGMEAEDG